MDGATFLVILGVAAVTALLNCALKHQPDPFAGSLLLAIAGGAVAFPLIFAAGLPAIECAPYFVVSVALNVLYWTFLGRAYESGDVGTVFPLAYGSAPAVVLLVTCAFVQEYPTVNQFAVIVVISGGLLLVLHSGAKLAMWSNRRMLTNCAALTAIICAFTIVDALGARRSGSPIAYAISLYACAGLAMLVYGATRHSRRLLGALERGWRPALFWGAASLMIYCGELWAMTRAPIALVAALRESSILFAAILAVVWLKEPLRGSRMAGAGAVALGLALMRLA